MSGSDRGGPRWPQKDRRAAHRRSASARAGAAPPGGERRRRERRDEAGWQAVPVARAAEPADADVDRLRDAAARAREHAQAPYSRFRVGAALETADGHIVTGCNIENATYGLTLCAERVALVKALSEGHTVFTRLFVSAETEAPTPPCGPCRQLLWEYCGDIDVILGTPARALARMRLAQLLPLPFDRRLLE